MHWRRSNVSLRALMEWAGGRGPRVVVGDVEAVVFQPSATLSTGAVGRRAFRDRRASTPRSRGDGYNMPTRGLITHAPIARGEVIVELPLTGALHASAAASLLSDWAAQQQRGGTELCKLIGDLASSSHQLPCVESREPLLLTAALAVLNHEGRRAASARSVGLDRWAPYLASLPPKVAPLAAVVAAVDKAASSMSMERRLRAGEVSLPLLGKSEATAEDKKQLMLTQLRNGVFSQEVGGDAAVVAAHAPSGVVEVVPTSLIATSFYNGDVVPRGGAHAQSQRAVEVPAFLGHVQEMNEVLEKAILSRMVDVLGRWAMPSHAVQASVPLSADDDDDVAVAVREAANSTSGCWSSSVAWAHFMVRSRTKWLKLHPQLTSQRSCVCAPIADLINHDGIHPNVKFVERPCVGGGVGYGTLLVVASRQIDPLEELTSDYHDEVYYPEESGASLTPAGSKGNAHEEYMRSIEREQRHEVVSATQSSRHQSLHPSRATGARATPKSHSRVAKAMQDEAASYGSRAFTSDEERKRLLNRRHNMSRRQGAVADAEWAFRFGFVKSLAEKEVEASCTWDDGLKGRIARLTDVRRKGRPGEFVVGVPEGLHHLQAERERLQRERFQGKAVFPPQRA